MTVSGIAGVRGLLAQYLQDLHPGFAVEDRRPAARQSVKADRPLLVIELESLRTAGLGLDRYLGADASGSGEGTGLEITLRLDLYDARTPENCQTAFSALAEALLAQECPMRLESLSCGAPAMDRASGAFLLPCRCTLRGFLAHGRESALITDFELRREET